MEVWKDVIGYEGLYQVSNMGNIRCLGFEGQSRKQGKKRYVDYVNPRLDKNGYYYVRLCHPILKSKAFMLHRLIAQAFIDNPKNKEQVNHINGIRSDNRIENLEWMTSKENLRHARTFLKNKQISYPTSGHKRKILGKKSFTVTER